MIDAGREVEESVADEAFSDEVTVNDVRAIDLVEAPTSTVPVTLTRPSCRHRLTKELFSRRWVLPVSIHAFRALQMSTAGLTCKR